MGLANRGRDPGPVARSEQERREGGGLEAGGLKALDVEKEMVVCDMQRAAQKANHG